ncbi:hypothetical protein [Haladaptatus sp. YSMS36]|uniref:hypothetical protein n=1 Tax=Haladaptatus sp. YSMS36 TaxID=3033384 RepID=UPI0034E97519
MTSALGLDDELCDRACLLFSTAQADGLLLGRSIEAMAAAGVYSKWCVSVESGWSTRNMDTITNVVIAHCASHH